MSFLLFFFYFERIIRWLLWSGISFWKNNPQCRAAWMRWQQRWTHDYFSDEDYDDEIESETTDEWTTTQIHTRFGTHSNTHRHFIKTLIRKFYWNFVVKKRRKKSSHVWNVSVSFCKVSIKIGICVLYRFFERQFDFDSEFMFEQNNKIRRIRERFTFHTFLVSEFRIRNP